MPTPAGLRASLHSELEAPRWWLGLSGGVDSLLLLHLLAELPARPPLAAVHIHHGLMADADRWEALCRQACAALGVAFSVRRVTVAETGEGLEAAARHARYAAFAELLQDGEVLLLAHHRDDQLETLLMRLLRGAGVDGLAGMPARRSLGRGRLVRPLLQHSRGEIIAAARQRGLSWVDDPSNADLRFERGFLRTRLLPLLAERWPDYPQRLQRSLDQLGEARAVLEEQAAADLEASDYRRPDQSLALAAIAALSAARQSNLLRYWLRLLELPSPPARAWAQWPQLLAAQTDAQPLWHWSGVELRRFQGRLYPLLSMPAVAADPPAWIPPASWSAAGMGSLEAERVEAGGLRSDRPYHITRRRGGERCRPLGRAHSQTLKKLLQEYAVPPWWRDRVPLIHCGDELAAVGDYWVCEGYQAGPGESGWRLRWSPPGMPSEVPSEVPSRRLPGALRSR